MKNDPKLYPKKANSTVHLSYIKLCKESFFRLLLWKGDPQMIHMVSHHITASSCLANSFKAQRLLHSSCYMQWHICWRSAMPFACWMLIQWPDKSAGKSGGHWKIRQGKENRRLKRNSWWSDPILDLMGSIMFVILPPQSKSQKSTFQTLLKSHPKRIEYETYLSFPFPFDLVFLNISAFLQRRRTKHTFDKLFALPRWTFWKLNGKALVLPWSWNSSSEPMCGVCRRLGAQGLFCLKA